MGRENGAWGGGGTGNEARVGVKRVRVGVGEIGREGGGGES